MSTVDETIDSELRNPTSRNNYACALAAHSSRHQGERPPELYESDERIDTYRWTHKEYHQGHYDGWTPSGRTIKDIAILVVSLIIIAVVLWIVTYLRSKFILGTPGM